MTAFLPTKPTEFGLSCHGTPIHAGTLGTNERIRTYSLGHNFFDTNAVKRGAYTGGPVNVPRPGSGSVVSKRKGWF